MITVRYFAGARAAAGTTEEKVSAETLEELTRILSDAHGPALAKVLDVASFLVDEVVAHDRRAPLPADASVDVLPPFAGG
ncbi:MoaD/ThiS family protein [Planosporangium thailandense]|uniref:MoaD/ThiS family protein n=1 Tax=Planosporangium thailandense TaxID=765197 RepID=A0ABX0XST7_9ACTN|nr:MoaD/ThiS family protein [Planosporangium thailandense]NJC68876.1 MoaD/ThiS family protein [Planosporangium thailandense]